MHTHAKFEMGALSRLIPDRCGRQGQRKGNISNQSIGSKRQQNMQLGNILIYLLHGEVGCIYIYVLFHRKSLIFEKYIFLDKEFRD